uniref:Large ribosomal subunit protein bL17m n=1 Tax=Hyalomma excavatum TaxID=257692 RepID=A0A131XGM2_9ACAR
MADATRLIPALRHFVKHRHRNLSSPQKQLGRVEKIRETLTALFKHERIELNHPRADEVRGYAERLIAEAIRYGDCHARTMELADYWIKEKQLVHKLFKVLAPRFATYQGSYTQLHILPTPFNDKFNSMEPGPHYKYNWVALELKGNPYPPVPGTVPRNPNFLPNVLLSEARKEMHRMQFAEKVPPVAPPEPGTSVVTQRCAKPVSPPGGTPPTK